MRRTHGHTSRSKFAPGKKQTRVYAIWRTMRARCNNPKSKKFPRYGGRGIRVCERWDTSFEAFLADMGEPQEGMTLDRKDVDGHYEPDNCRWASWADQRRNRADVRLEPHEPAQIRWLVTDLKASPTQVARFFEINKATVHRIRRGDIYRSA